MGWGNTSQTASNKRTEVRIRLLTDRQDELLRQAAESERLLAEATGELANEVLRRIGAEKKAARLERQLELLGTAWLADIAEERQRAHAKHGDTSMESTPAHDPTGRRYRILCEEVGEIAEEFNDAEHEQRPVDLGRLRKELIQAAAMAGAWADACSAEEMSDRAASAIADFVLADAEARGRAGQCTCPPSSMFTGPSPSCEWHGHLAKQ